MSSISRLSNPILDGLGFDSIGLRPPIATNIDEQLVNNRQYFPDNGIEGNRIESLNVSKLLAGNIRVETYLQSTGYVAGTTGWRIDGAGNAEFASITLTGGTLNFGKTSFSDSTHAGYYISSSGIYFGAISDTTYLKYDIGGATLAYVGTISGRESSALATAINASANLVTDLINARLDSSAKTILSGFTFGAADYAGALNAGTVTWNTTTGAITGGSGVIVYRGGIVGVNTGVTTFSIDATTGAATFAGLLSAPTGSIGGFTIGASSLSVASGGNTTTLSSGATAFSAGPTGSPTVTITQAGIITAAGAVIDGTSTLGGRLGSTLASAINSSGNLITDLINARLDSSAKTILSGFTFGSADYSGALNAGSVTWNTTTGAITGGSGVIVYRSGIVGVNAGVTTFSIDATTGAATFAGALSAPTGTIGGLTIGATTLSVTSGGNTTTISSGSTAFSAGPTASPTVSITQAGVLTASAVVISGALTTGASSSIDGQYLGAATVASAAVNLALRGWTQTSVFSVTDLNTVEWASGTFTSSDGTAYSISAGNTGNMAARTYVYLDINVSTTAYQVTTTAATAVGNGKVLIATAINGATEPTFTVFGGVGGQNIDAASIVAGSITTNEIAASTITAGNMNVSQLSAITADLGAITAGTITLNSSGYVRGGQTDYNTGTGFFLGYSGGAYKLSIGDTVASNSLTWDGTTLRINGSRVSNQDIYGTGFDGAFALDGTNTYADYFSKSGSTYTLLKDIFATTITTSSSSILITNGFRIFASTSITNASGCYIRWNGNDGGVGTDVFGTTGGAGGGAGTGLTSNSLYGSENGTVGSSGGNGGGFNSNGGVGTTGTAGAATANSFAASYSVAGAKGGKGGDGPATYVGGQGGTVGVTGSITASSTRPYSANFAIDMFDKIAGAYPAFLKYNGLSGGSTGGGGGAYNTSTGTTGGGGGGGGGNGSNGGTIVIASPVITNAGTIEANGGAGGNGGAGSNTHGAGYGNGGGGAAGVPGAGGNIVLVYATLSGAGSITAASGAAGTAGASGGGLGGPADGATKTNSAGSIIQIIV